MGVDWAGPNSDFQAKWNCLLDRGSHRELEKLPPNLTAVLELSIFLL